MTEAGTECLGPWEVPDVGWQMVRQSKKDGASPDNRQLWSCVKDLSLDYLCADIVLKCLSYFTDH